MCSARQITGYCRCYGAQLGRYKLQTDTNWIRMGTKVAISCQYMHDPCRCTCSQTQVLEITLCCVISSGPLPSLLVGPILQNETASQIASHITPLFSCTTSRRTLILRFFSVAAFCCSAHGACASFCGGDLARTETKHLGAPRITKVKYVLR